MGSVNRRVHRSYTIDSPMLGDRKGKKRAGAGGGGGEHSEGVGFTGQQATQTELILCRVAAIVSSCFVRERDGAPGGGGGGGGRTRLNSKLLFYKDCSIGLVKNLC